MADRLVELTLVEIKPDSADYKNRLTLSGTLKIGVQVPETMFVGDDPEYLTPEGLAYVMTEVDLAIQRGYALRRPDYDAVATGEYYRKEKRK